MTFRTRAFALALLFGSFCGCGASKKGGEEAASRCASVTCLALDPCHEVGTCDPATGACSNPTRANGTSCDDGNACTSGDTCQSGACVAGVPRVCIASDPCHEAGTCDPATGACSNPARANGTSCDDGNACTSGDGCHSGACLAGAPRVCLAADQCHEGGTCDPATGLCTNPSAPDGTLCAAGDAIAGCLAGGCSPQPIGYSRGDSLTATIDGAGGALAVTGPGGIAFRVEFPPGALLEPRDITLTAIDAGGSLPSTLAPVGGVLVEPDGLELTAPAVLTATFPGPIDGPLNGVSLAPSGQGLEIIPAWVAGSTATLLVSHFSPEVLARHLDCSGVPLGGLTGMAYVDAKLANLNIAAHCRYPNDGDARAAYFLEHFPPIAYDLYQLVILDRLMKAEADPARLPDAVRAILLLFGWNLRTGGGIFAEPVDCGYGTVAKCGDLDDLEARARDDLRYVLLSGAKRADESCKTTGSDFETIQYIDYAHLICERWLSNPPLIDDEVSRVKTCGVLAVTLEPSGTLLLEIGASERFTAQHVDGAGDTVALPANVAVFWDIPPVLAFTRDSDLSGTGQALESGTGILEVSLFTRPSAYRMDRAWVEIVVPSQVRVTVEPASVDLGLAEEVRLTARAFDESGATVACGFTWATSDSRVAALGLQEATSVLVRGVTRGDATISASCLGATGSAHVRVGGHYVLEPSAACLAVGEQFQFTVSTTGGIRVAEGVTWSVPLAYSALGTPVDRRGSVLMIGQSGLATAVSPGKAMVLAEVEGKGLLAPVLVTVQPVCGTWALSVSYEGHTVECPSTGCVPSCTPMDPVSVSFTMVEDVLPNLERLFSAADWTQETDQRMWLDPYGFAGPGDPYCDYAFIGPYFSNFVEAILYQVSPYWPDSGMPTLWGGVGWCISGGVYYDVNQTLDLASSGGVTTGSGVSGGYYDWEPRRPQTCLTEGQASWTGTLVGSQPVWPLGELVPAVSCGVGLACLQFATSSLTDWQFGQLFNACNGAGFDFEALSCQVRPHLSGSCSVPEGTVGILLPDAPALPATAWFSEPDFTMSSAVETCVLPVAEGGLGGTWQP